MTKQQEKLKIDCETAQEFLAAKIAIEISDGHHRQLAGHLIDCQACRLIERQWQTDDRKLNRELGSKKHVARAVADSVMDRVRSEATGGSTTAVTQLTDVSNLADNAVVTSNLHRSRRNRGILTTGLAMAVGFLLAAVTLQQWLGDARDITASKSAIEAPDSSIGVPAVAQLVASTGQIRGRSTATADWIDIDDIRTFVCEPSTEIETGPNSRCEITTVDGCVVRLNVDTKLVVETGRRVRVLKGQIWCRSGGHLPMEVVVDSGEHAAHDDLPIYQCPFGSVCMLKVAEPALEAQASDGRVTMVTSQGRRVINPGQSLMMTSSGKVTAKSETTPLLASGWMDSLLVLKGHSDPDLKQRVDALLTQVGESNASLLYERELRNLGEHCVLPLTCYVQSPKSRETRSRRLKAMTVVADVSPTWNSRNLISLLDDEDGEVRVLAARALQRLTGNSHGHDSHEWREQAADLTGVRDAWSDWWMRNSDRFRVIQTTENNL